MLHSGAGSSYVAGSLANTLVEMLDQEICLCHKKRTNFPHYENITEYTRDDDFSGAFDKGVVIYDRGVFGTFTREEMVEMRRSDTKIIVRSGEEGDIQRPARLIHKLGESAEDWIYVFNLVPSKKRKYQIMELMEDYDYMFLPAHDYEEIPKKIQKMWEKQLKGHTDIK